MAAKKASSEKFRLVIAGARLLKGNLDTLPCPEISFVSDSPAEAENNRKALETYLNAWEAKHGHRPKKKKYD